MQDAIDANSFTQFAPVPSIRFAIAITMDWSKFHLIDRKQILKTFSKLENPPSLALD